MSLRFSPPLKSDNPVCYYRSEGRGDAMRSRSVSPVVLHATLEVPPPPSPLLADWRRETAARLGLEPGDVEQLPLARARARWPDYARCMQAMSHWTAAVGLEDLLSRSDSALMACRGARYHHDGVQYGGMAFCNLFLCEDQGLDLHFPATGLRIPLVRGTAVVFDTGQPHAVVARASSGFLAQDFAAENCIQVFLSWELPIEDAQLAQVMQVAFDTEAATAQLLGEEQVRVNGTAASLCPNTGRWLAHPVP